MKFTFFLIIIFTLLINPGCRDHTADNGADISDTTEVAETPAGPEFEQFFPELYTYLHRQDPAFNPSLFEETAIMEKPDSVARTLDMQELKPFLPYLRFNQDSTYALDIVTYNYVPVMRNGKLVLDEGGPDYEVGLINMVQHKRKQLLFFGTMGIVMDSRWADKDDLHFVVAAEWVGQDSLRVEQYHYSVRDQTLQKFSYPSFIHADWSKYPKVAIR